MTNADLIEHICMEFRDIESVRGLFLSGSYGYGSADDQSDIDLLMIVGVGTVDQCIRDFRNVLSAYDSIVLWRVRPFATTIVNSITSRWRRCDVEITTAATLRHRYQDGLKPLIDRDALYQTLPALTPVAPLNGNRISELIEEFVRVLGLLVVVIKREEYVNGVSGVAHLRNQLISLMIEAVGRRHKGGALHLNRLLPHEHMQALQNLPAVLPTRESVIAAHLAHAEVFLPLARSLAAQAHAEWPQDFIDATWAYLGRELGATSAGIGAGT